MRVFRLPDLGEGLQEAELLEWLVAVGDEVAAGAVLARVETDKAQVDVTAPFAGRVARLHGEPGQSIRVGEPLVGFDGEAEATQAPATPSFDEDPGTVVGRLPEPGAEAAPAVAQDASAVNAEQNGREASATPATRAMPAARRLARTRAMPAARRLARTRAIALEGLIGTGPDGVIMRADVERASRSPRSGGEDVVPEGYEPLRGVRLAMARNMARARDAVVPATLMDEIDVEAWWTPEADVSVRLLRAIAVGCAAEPALNAWLDEGGRARRIHDRVDVAVAIQTPDGLFAPVLRGVGSASSDALRAGLDRLIADCEARTLAPETLRGATITLSNFGLLAGRHAMLVVVPPQVAILGAGRVERRVVAWQGEVAVRARLPLSLTFDHRAVTGGEAAGFVEAMRADLARFE